MLEGVGMRGKWCRIEFLLGVAVVPVGGRELFLGRFFVVGTVENSKMLEIVGMVVGVGCWMGLVANMDARGGVGREGGVGCAEDVGFLGRLRLPRVAACLDWKLPR